MSTEPLLTSDVIGLTKAAPFSRRGFMTASAAVDGRLYACRRPRAGRRDQDRHQRPHHRRRQDQGRRWRDARLFRQAQGVSNPPVMLVAMEIFGLHEYIKDVTRRLAKLGAFAVAPDYYFRKGVDLTKITDIPQLLPIVNSKPDAELLSDLDSTVAWAKAQGGDTVRLGIIGFCRGGRTVWEYAAHSPTLKAGVGVLRPAGRSAEPALAEEPDAARARDEGAGDRTLRRGRYRHSRRHRRGAEGGARREQEDRRVQDLSGRPARLPRRLSRQLSQGSRRRCVERRCRPGSRSMACSAKKRFTKT